MSSANSTYIKVGKGVFTTGTLGMYLNTTTSPKEREIEGKVLLKLTYPSFVKGVWIKLVGTNSVSSEKFGVLSSDLFLGDEDHHKDGLHQVLIGFGEGDNSHGTYLEMGAGRHSWPFHFKLPYYAPASYFDGNNAISYKLVLIIDSPLVQTANNRLTLQHECVAANYSNFSYVRLKEAQVTENRELLQKGSWLTAPKGNTHPAGGILPSIMNILRTPATLSISSNPNGNYGAPVGASAANCALFPFQTKQHEYEVLCSLSNVRSKHPIILKSELYIEVCTRSSAKQPFPVHYPHVIGQPNSAADELGSAVNIQQNKHYSSSRTQLIWSGCTEVAPTDVEQVVLKVPVNIDSEQRLLALNHKPSSVPLLQANHTGKIVQYSVEAPLFRYRIMLKVSAMRGEAPTQSVCAPVFGEMYVLPPRPESESSVLAMAPVSVRAGMPRLSNHASSSTAVAPANIAGVAAAGVQASSALPSILTDSSSLGSQETSGPSPVPAMSADGASSRVRRNSRSNRVTIQPAAEDTPTAMRRWSRPSLVEGMPTTAATTAGAALTATESATSAANVSSEEPEAPAVGTELVSSGASAVALAPSRPASGSSSRSSRSVRNHGGIASFRAAQSTTTAAGANVSTTVSCNAPAVVSVGNNENAHPNVAASKTPHAKATKTSHVIRVEAELLSRGPAAVVIDRNERRNEPIRTPQRFAFMYQVGVANVIEGTPIVTAPTPVMINTVEYRAARRLYNQNYNDFSEPSTPAGALAGAAAYTSTATPGANGGTAFRQDEIQGFQYYNLESATGTPQPPRRPDHSMGSSFEDSSSFAMDDAMIADSDAVVAMPLPAEDNEDEMHAMSHSTSRQRRLFRSTFDGVDWLVRNATTDEPVETERALHTSRYTDNDVSLEDRLVPDPTEDPAVDFLDARHEPEFSTEQVDPDAAPPVSMNLSLTHGGIANLPTMVC